MTAWHGQAQILWRFPSGSNPPPAVSGVLPTASFDVRGKNLRGSCRSLLNRLPAGSSATSKLNTKPANVFKNRTCVLQVAPALRMSRDHTSKTNKGFGRGRPRMRSGEVVPGHTWPGATMSGSPARSLLEARSERAVALGHAWPGATDTEWQPSTLTSLSTN